MGSSYTPVAVRALEAKASKETAESLFWEKFSSHTSVKQYAQVTDVHFSPASPHDFAVTSATRVQIFSSRRNVVTKTISRFRDVAYGGAFRSDGKLVVAGGEEGRVRVFDLASRNILRMYSHSRTSMPVFVTRFASDKTSLVSGGADALFRTWSLTNEDPVATFRGHTDAVRCAVESPSSPGVWFTASQDHTVRMWDTREGGEQHSVILEHEAPVGALLVFPSGGVVVTGAGPSLFVWDVLTGGRLLHTLSLHQKPITDLSFDGTHTRFASASLDAHLKIVDAATYEVTHTMKYPAPILSAAISPDNTHIVAGLTNGLVDIRHRPATATDRAETKERAARPGTFQYFIRGKNAKPSQGDFVVEGKRRQRLTKYDAMMKKFRYGAALDAVLEEGEAEPVVVVSLLVELTHRDGLEGALRGRDDEGLVPILTFLADNLTDPSFASILIDITNVIFDLYTSTIGRSAVVDDLFHRLSRAVKREVALQKDLLGLLGALESLMSVNDTAALAGLADGDEEAEAGAGGSRSGGAGDDIEALLGMDAAPTSTT